jgi:dienelactone hydrolase
MRTVTVRLLLATTLVALPGLAGAQAPAPKVVTLKAADATALTATYYAAAKPGPGIVLLHQCNRDRGAWTTLAKAAADRGYHVVAMDYRGFGESEGQRFTNFQEQQPIIQEKWPGDIDAAFTFLTSQSGVDRARIAAAGASCGVNQSVQLSRRHPEVKTVVLLSGGITPEAREHLRRTPGLTVMAAASLDDGDAVNTMRWILGWSRNPANEFIELRAAGHGTDMFAVEKTLEPAILDWFDAHLRKATDAPLTSSAPADSKPTAIEEFWAALAKPDGAARARQIYDETRAKDPKVVLFPEGEANQYGYQLLQTSTPAHAVWVFELTAAAYPKSANVYDSLADAYLAAGRRDEALRNAEQALKVLETDTTAPAEFRSAIKESAEKKIKELRKPSEGS